MGTGVCGSWSPATLAGPTKSDRTEDSASAASSQPSGGLRGAEPPDYGFLSEKDGSILMPGLIVELTVMPLRYLPFAADGFWRTSSSSTAW
jgi:hypothetical protein